MVTREIDVLESGYVEANVVFEDMEQMNGLLIPMRSLSSGGRGWEECREIPLRLPDSSRPGEIEKVTLG